jgi:endonuclease YncB( thermonuclease family)
MQIRGVITRVIDGDTVWVRVRVRLLDSAPELGTAAGEQAHVSLARRWPPGARVQVRQVATDGYGRIVGTLAEDHTEDRG